MPVTPYSEPSLQEFVSIKPVPTVSTQVEQGTVIVAPHYDLTDLRDSAGNLNPAAKIGDVKISSLTAKWYASTGMGEAEFPIQSVDSARRVDESTMRVFGAVGTNASLFEITGENDEVVVRTGTASFVYDQAGESSSAGSTIYLVDETANWSSIFTRSQIPFATNPNVYDSEGTLIGENPASYPNYNKFMLVVRVYDALVLVGEFAVRPLVLAGSPKQLELIGGPYANSLVYAAWDDGLPSDVTANRTYELVYKPQLWSIEQAPTAAKARVVAMDRPALSVNEEKVRLTLFRHRAGATPSTQAVPLVAGGNATLMNVSNSNVTVTVTVTSPEPSPPAPTTVVASGASVTITYGGIATTVAELNDLIVGEYGTSTPAIYFDEIGVDTSQVDFATWASAGIVYYPPQTLIVPVYTTHVHENLRLNAYKPEGSLLSATDGYTVEVDNRDVDIYLNGRNGLFMTPAGVVSALFSDINQVMDDDSPAGTGDLYLKSPFKLLLTDEFLAYTSEWRLLTPAGLAVADFQLFTVGASGATSMDATVRFKPSSFVASIDVVSELLGSLGNRYQLQYRLAWDGVSSITYENETITITQAVSDSTGYIATPLTLGNLTTALLSNPSFVDANGGRLFDYGNAWSNNGFADNPVPVADLTAPIYPECFASPTDGYYSAPTAAVKVIAPSVNDINLTGGTFRARVKINPLALYSNTSTANASIYVDFRALRLDTTAVTTLSAYGRRPDLVALTRDNYVEVLGPVVPSNPAAVAAHEFYRVGGQRALWFLGVDEIDTTTEGHRYGTPAAIGRAIDLIVRRTGYNVGVLSYGTEIRNLILQKITDLGGTETLRLIKGMDFWIPLKSPDRYPDFLVESSDYVGTGGMGNYYVYTTSDFSSNEAAATAVADGELFLVVAGDPDASGANAGSTLYDLGDGKRGWKVTELIAADDPSWVEVEGGFDYVGLEEGDGLLFYRRGFGLITAAGRNMQATAEALSINESAATSMRLMKILGDTATRTINGIEYRLPHELVMVGQTLGLLQQLGPTEPCTGLEYFGIRELTGTNDVFTIPQLDLIRGGGAFIPTQEQAGARRTRVSFDVSSDMTNSYTINRCLHVTDDLLSERIRRRIDPLRSARRVDQLLIDEISLQINTEVESVQRKYEAINLVAVAVLTDEQKVKYGIDARRSGLYVQIYKKHPKISSDLILENIIEF